MTKVLPIKKAVAWETGTVTYSRRFICTTVLYSSVMKMGDYPLFLPGDGTRSIHNRS